MSHPPEVPSCRFKYPLSLSFGSILPSPTFDRHWLGVSPFFSYSKASFPPAQRCFFQHECPPSTHCPLLLMNLSQFSPSRNFFQMSFLPGESLYPPFPKSGPPPSLKNSFPMENFSKTPFTENKYTALSFPLHHPLSPPSTLQVLALFSQQIRKPTSLSRGVLFFPYGWGEEDFPFLSFAWYPPPHPPPQLKPFWLRFLPLLPKKNLF